MALNVKQLLKASGNEYASLAEKGIITDTNDNGIDTGSYTLNALLSGSIYGGMSSNKITALAGESGVGKTYFALQACQAFQDQFESGLVVYFDTEAAITQAMLEERGIDTSRFIMMPVATVEDWRTQCSKILSEYEGMRKDDPEARLFMVLDSLGNLSTTKEVTDIESGAGTRDMTRAANIKGAFRALTLKLAKLNVPLLLTNHTYETMAMYSQKTMSGGSGPIYNASTIVFLSKAKEKDGKELIGNVINMRLFKGRQTRDGSLASTRLYFDSGLERHYGLMDIVAKHGVLPRSGNRWETDHGLQYDKAIYNNPEKFFTEEFLEKIDEACKKEFLYGSSIDEVEESEDETDV
jgi:RecA/RadA recombinase